MTTDQAIAPEDQREMQALIGSGFGTLCACEYVLLDIDCAPPARAWLAQVLHEHLVWPVSALGHQKKQDALRNAAREEAWSVAFTHRGLERLGIAEDPDAPFPSEFKAGQASEIRRRLLCEDPAVCWQWGDVPVPARAPQPEPVSVLVVRAHHGTQPHGHRLLETDQLAASGLRLVRRVQADPHCLRTATSGGRTVTYLVEPFGFRDGMGQPKVQGLQTFRSCDPEPRQQQALVPLGEFVLGHPNAYGEASHCPEVLAQPGVPASFSFGRNGCYLAVQQILQDVDAFAAFEAAHPPVGDAASLVEKMIGRRKDGRPLQVTPQALGPDDDFSFLTNDPHGFQCPVGAHVRRAHPRDTVPDASEGRPDPGHLHRLLRRSRPYASTGPIDAQAPPQGTATEVGMFFIAIVADLSRQFEFVKRAWIGNPRFGNLSGEVDPLLGRSQGRCFTTPGQPIGSRVESLPDLTQTRGGGYFFMPGLTTLQRIAAGDYTTGSEA